MHISEKNTRTVESRFRSLLINLHKHQLYLLELHSDSSQIWLAMSRIKTEGNSFFYEL